MSASSTPGESAPAPPAPVTLHSTRAADARGPWLAFFACGLIWGSTFLVISIGNDTLPPMWAAAIRLAIGGVVLSIITRLVGHAFPRGAALKAAVLFGVCQFGLNFPLLYFGEKTVPSGLSAVLFATVPLSSAIVTRLFGMERLNPLKILGALIAIGGVALLGGVGSSSHGSPTLGVISVVAAATISAFGATFLKRGPRQSAWGATAVGHLVGLPICLALSALGREHWFVPRDGRSWFTIVYLVVMGSSVAFALMAWLIQRWPVTRVAFVSVIVPIIALFLGALVRHEPLTGRSLAGAGLVLVGLGCGMAADRGRAGAH